MQTIDMSEILGLYKKCNVNVYDNGIIRNTLNLGTLDNKLNAGGLFENGSKIESVWSNNTVSQK